MREVGQVDFDSNDEETVEYLDEDYLEEEDETLIEVETLIKCNICAEDVAQQTLQQHMEQKHFKFKCPQCEKMYFSESLLRKHLRSAHLESMNLKCPFCPVVLKRKYNFQQHLYTHSTKAMFKCSYETCSKSFKHVNTLKQHEKIHENRNRRECPICHENVTRLQLHVLTHSDNRPFVCEICDRGYVTKKHLENHKTSHSEDGHRCDICNAIYKSVASLYKHTKTVHASKRYECPNCGQCYSRRDNMLSHMKRVHDGTTSVNRRKRKEAEPQHFDDSDF